MAMVPELVKIRIAKRYKQLIVERDYTNYPNDLETAIELHRWVKRVMARLHRANEEHEAYIKKAIFAEDVL